MVSQLQLRGPGEDALEGVSGVRLSCNLVTFFTLSTSCLSLLTLHYGVPGTLGYPAAFGFNP